MSTNRWIGIGRLTKPPELRYTPQGNAVATFTVAVDRDFKPEGAAKAETDFIPIVAWRKLAETVAQHLAKGRLVAVEGRIQVRSYEAKDGGKRWATEIIADQVRFLDHAKAQDKPADGAGETVPARAEPDDEAKVDDSDIPF